MAASATPLNATRKEKARTDRLLLLQVRTQAPFVCTYRVESSIVVDRAVCHGTRFFFFFWLPRWRMKKLLFLFRAIATDDVACGQDKEVIDSTVALCPRAFICRKRFLRFVRVLQCTMLFSMLCSAPTIIGTSPTRYQEIFYYFAKTYGQK